MKVLKVVKIVFISIFMIAFLFLFAYQQSHYVRHGHVVLVKQYGVNNKYAFTDATGNTYEFWTTEAISPYDSVTVTMNNNKTDDNVKDDVIEGYKITCTDENENTK